MADNNVVRLIDCAAGIPPDDHADLCDWLAQWSQNLKKGDHGTVRSLMVVVEGESGQLALLCQSVAPLDRARMVGLLHMAALQRAEGGARIDDLKP